MRFCTSFILFSIMSYKILAQHMEDKSNISSEIFFDYYYNIQRDTNATYLTNAVMDDSKNLNGFRFRRIFFTYDYSFSKKIKARIRLDSDEKSNTSNGNIGVFMKDVYLEFDSFMVKHKIRVGIQPTPIFELSEKYWYHRFLEKTILDQRYLVYSRDLGISLSGQINKINYCVLLGNNSINKPEIDRFKAIYSNVNYQLTKEMHFSISYAYYFMPKTKNFYSPLYPNDLLNANKQVISLFWGVRNSIRWSLGMEGFYMKWLHNYNTGSSMDNLESLGLSLFVWFRIYNPLSFCWRIDFYEPNIHSLSKYDRRLWSLIALDYRLSDKIILSPNVSVEYYEPQQNGIHYKKGITAQMTLFWKF